MTLGNMAKTISMSCAIADMNMRLRGCNDPNNKHLVVGDELVINLVLLLQSHSKTRIPIATKIPELQDVLKSKTPYNDSFFAPLLLKERVIMDVKRTDSKLNYIINSIKESKDMSSIKMELRHAVLFHSDELLSFALEMRNQYIPRFGIGLFANSELRFPSEDRFKFIKSIETDLLEIISLEHKANCFDDAVNVAEFEAIKYATDYYDLIKFYRAQGDEEAQQIRLMGEDSVRLSIKDVIENINYAITRKDAYTQIESRKGALASKTLLRSIESLLIKHKQKLNENGTSSEHIDKMHNALLAVLPR